MSSAVDLYRRPRGSFALDASSETGRLLTLCHSRSGRAECYRFTHAVFDAAGRSIAACDQRGDVHLIRLDSSRSVGKFC